MDMNIFKPSLQAAIANSRVVSDAEAAAMARCLLAVQKCEVAKTPTDVLTALRQFVVQADKAELNRYDDSMEINLDDLDDFEV